ncbi:hypothetical protein Tco_0833547 [Tanacetum coccineum]
MGQTKKRFWYQYDLSDFLDHVDSQKAQLVFDWQRCSGKPLTIRFGLEFKGEIVKIQLYQDGNIGLASYKLCTTTQSMRGSASRVMSDIKLHGRDVYLNLQGSNGMVIYKEVPPPVERASQVVCCASCVKSQDQERIEGHSDPNQARSGRNHPLATYIAPDKPTTGSSTSSHPMTTRSKAGNDESVIATFTSRLNHEFAIKDLGALNYFLGLEVAYTDNVQLFIDL